MTVPSRLAADLLCPERCASCEAIVGSEQLFCHACRACVNVLGPPECEQCGVPLAAAGRCAACASDVGRSPIRQARAWAAYGGGEPKRPVTRALAAFKYRGLQRLGRRMAAVMAPRVAAVMAQNACLDATTGDPPLAAAPADSRLIVPVPLHLARLRKRGFNQSAVLARHLGRCLGLPVALRLLVRTRDTSSQTALSASERRANVASAFAVRNAGTARARHVLLVDDVWTSGATAGAAASALLRDGARTVDVVTFARVL